MLPWRLSGVDLGRGTWCGPACAAGLPKQSGAKRRASGAALIFFLWVIRQRAWCQRSSGPIDVTAVADVDDGDDMGLVVDPVDDAVGSASCAEPVI